MALAVITEALLRVWLLTMDLVCSQNAVSNATNPATRRMMPGIESCITKQIMPKTSSAAPTPPQTKGALEGSEGSCGRSCCIIVVCVFFLAVSSAIRRLSVCLLWISSSAGTPAAKVRFNASYCFCSLSGKTCADRLWISTSRSWRVCSQSLSALSSGMPLLNSS